MSHPLETRDSARPLLNVSIQSGDEAWTALASTVMAEWLTLSSQCTWATVFQSPAFARVWYRIYRDQYDPLLVSARDGQGALVALLPLAREKKSGAIVHVGAHHAEYQGWLCLPEHGETAPVALLGALRRTMQGRTLRLLFLPPDTPLGWVTATEVAGMPVALKHHRRGLMRVGAGSDVETSLRKSANKSRISRLSRLGALSLDQLKTRAELESVMSVIMEQCDVRQGAVHSVLPFASDPLKRELYLGFMDEPGLAHTTVLRAGGHLIASHLSLCDARAVPLGLITHAPQFAAHSPGKLMILYLGRLLGAQGYSMFDLTPGGAYKDRFASEVSDAWEVQVFFRPLSYRTDRWRRQVIEAAVRVTDRGGFDLRKAAHAVKRRATRAEVVTLPSRLANRLARFVYDRADSLFYRMSAAQVRALPEVSLLRRDAVGDLTRYEQAERTDRPVSSFLRDAVERLESGIHVYTMVEDGRLIHYSWLNERQKRTASEFGQPLDIPDRSSMLFDDYTHPVARGRGLHTASLIQRARDAVIEMGAEWVYVSVLLQNTASRRNIERVGFERVHTFTRRVTFGRVRLT